MTETMTPKELMELAERVDGFDPAACVAGAVALRSYAELIAALEYLDGEAASVLKALTDNLQTENVTGGGLVAFAKRLGWPGLGEP